MKNVISIKHTGGNATETVRAVIDAIRDDCENIIEFEKGEYRFYREGSLHCKTYSSCGPVAEIDAIFPILNKKNVTIDGMGSEFIFCDRVQPFKIECCENITLTNFSIDFAFLRYAYADVYEVSDEGIGICFDESIFSYEVADGKILFNCGSEQISTGDKKISSKRMLPSKGGTYFIYAGDFSGEYNRAAPNVKVNAEKASKGVFLRYRPENTAKTDFRVGDKVCLAYDNDREAQSCHCEFSKNITLRNVTIYRQGGMGFVADVSEDITLDNFNIMIKEGRNEFFPTTADGIYLTSCGGDFNIKNCTVSHTYDDAMNVHGFYMKVEKALGDGQAKVGFLHEHHTGLLPFRKGDVVAFSTPGDFNEIGTGTIEEFSYDENRENIVIKYNTSTELYEGLLIENKTLNPRVSVENNTFESCPHVRLSAHDMVIKNNSFDLNANDIYICDLIDFWGECGAVDNAVITGNKFGKKSFNNIEILSCRPTASNHLHGKIVIKNNKFENPSEKAIKASHVGELTVSENAFEVSSEN